MAYEEGAAESVKKRALMKPPGILVALGFVKPGVWREALKVVYGYRQSPRQWSDHRDDVLCGMKIQDGAKVIRVSHMLSKPNMWKIVEEDAQGQEETSKEAEETLRGLMSVYVDDRLVLGELSIIYQATEGEQSKRGWLMAGQDLLRRNLGEDQPKISRSFLKRSEAPLRSS